MKFFENLRYNLDRVLREDPAAESKLMIYLTYPHIKALNYHYVHISCIKEKNIH